MKTLITVSALGLSLGMAATASAEPARAASSAMTSAATDNSTTSTAPKQQVDKRRYCVVNTPTGSRIERKECNTRAEWLKQGFDPLAAQ